MRQSVFTCDELAGVPRDGVPRATSALGRLVEVQQRPFWVRFPRPAPRCTVEVLQLSDEVLAPPRTGNRCQKLTCCEHPTFLSSVPTNGNTRSVYFAPVLM